jgi:uncharacterized protein DUF6894
MPRYFFHLSFGDRLLPDEEGVELSSRAAARREALAVVRDLSGSVAGRWAGWFLRVADQAGQFLSLPIGHPALELVSDGALQRQSTRGAGQDGDEPSARGQAGSLHELAAALFEQASELRGRTAQLLERNRQLQSELSSELCLNQAVGDRARQLISHARLATASGPEISRIAARPADRIGPDLIVLPGGKVDSSLD